MALFLALTLFHHLIDGFHNRDLRNLVVDLLGVTSEHYTAAQMTYDLRRFRPAVAMFSTNDAVLPFPLRASLNRVDAQLDELIYQAFPQAKASCPPTNLAASLKI
jgi:hypothetical protein